MRPAAKVLANAGPFVLALVILTPFITVRWVQYLALAMIVGLSLVCGVAMGLSENDHSGEPHE